MARESPIPEQEREGALAARLRGATNREVAEELGLSVEGARKLLLAEARRQVDLLQARLEVGEVFEMAIPAVGGGQFEDGLAHIQWVVSELRARGVQVKVLIGVRAAEIVVALTNDPEGGEPCR